MEDIENKIANNDEITMEAYEKDKITLTSLFNKYKVAKQNSKNNCFSSPSSSSPTRQKKYLESTL